jgi:tRNA nucleotidyltransferase/poly(A) polymerase
MKQYVVGGAVRDVLLGRNPTDIDYVWVGATKEDMLNKGFIEPVGSAFPVFLDAVGNQHALARTERKTGAGYHGFDVVYDPSVTIEDDLYRRDFTINAMAVEYDNWIEFLVTKNPSLVVDPYHGIDDLDRKVIRHVSDHFYEDPLRVLRAARFHARYGFEIDPSTISVMIKAAEELDSLPYDRIWVELEKAMMESEGPTRFFSAMARCDVMYKSKKLEPLLKRVITWMPFATGNLSVSDPDAELLYRLAMITMRFDSDQFNNFRVPLRVQRLAVALCNSVCVLTEYTSLDRSQKIGLFNSLRMFNDLELFSMVAECVQAGLKVQWFYPPCENIDQIIDLIKSDFQRVVSTVDASQVAAAAKAAGISIPVAIATARIEAL